jgi:hypothetical protein
LAINRGAVNGYAPLDANGKIPSGYLSSLSVIDVFIVTSEAEMLALEANAGDIAVRQDINAQLILQQVPATSIDNWVQLVSQASVTSINGQTGIVDLTTGDISETTNLYYTDTRVFDVIDQWTNDSATLTNKVIDSHTNKVGADSLHYKARSSEDLAVGDIVKVVGYAPASDTVLVGKLTSTSDVAVGVVKASMVSGTVGSVVNTGWLEGVDTSAWSFGTILYSDGTGGLTDVKPSTDYYQAVAYVLRSHASNGSILIECTEPRSNVVPADITALDV